MIVGLAGYAGAGKDSVADVMVRNHDFTRAGFADQLKAVALELNPTISVDWIPGSLSTAVEAVGWDQVKRWPGVRDYLQRIGMLLREQLHEDVWIDTLFRRLPVDVSDVVIPDVRFDNEVEAIRSRGGVVWLVRRPGVEPPNKHVSEHLASRVEHFFDHVIENDGYLDDLDARVSAALNGYIEQAWRRAVPVA